MNKRRGMPCIIVGIVSSALGIILLLVGNYIDNDTSHQLETFWSTGKSDTTGKYLFYGGIALLVAGAILLVLGILLYATSGNKSTNTYFGNNSGRGVSDVANLRSGNLIDNANQLSQEEKDTLLERIYDVQNKTELGIVILVLPNATNPLNRIGYDYYTSRNISKNCCILTVNAFNLDMFFSAYGRANYMFPPAKKQVIMYYIHACLRNQKYYEGYDYFLKCIEESVPSAAINNVSAANSLVTKHCSKCGAAVHEGDSFCVSCGCKIEE